MTPDMRVKLRGMVIKHEGFRASVYKDEFGHMTIGYGHNLEARPISEVVGGAMLDEDLQWFTAQLESKLSWFYELDDARKCVLIDMAFNLGLNGFLSFREMLDFVEVNEYSKAADAMMSSEWAKQVGQRAIDDAHIMRSGEI